MNRNRIHKRQEKRDPIEYSESVYCEKYGKKAQIRIHCKFYKASPSWPGWNTELSARGCELANPMCLDCKAAKTAIARSVYNDIN